ncbi:MAG: 2,3,4,5-tetrahydropyridine-2,6-dicarboxylate N-succinyltransferase [Candidatus Cloacimonetes bacterium]|jgi:2,3,4,5-tetrahydropyridine-2-carboxylate N-succinyltransferase|nr:2,3,4,5-tetrahydropyridine-2,6-dicarboxylate N-succinyltransferase [Candidatus Cloacimonadota bacterium]
MIEQAIVDLYINTPTEYKREHRDLFDSFILALNEGSIRACEKSHDGWKVNTWIKMGILIGFRMGVLAALPDGNKDFFDKDTLAAKRFTLSDQVRIVPGGTSARNGCYMAKGVTVMPPAFINIGAWVDSGTMVDSHALVGSCAQIGKRVHLSAGAMIGGVLEPIGSRPVIIEDDAFIGGNTGIYEGIIVQSRAVIASGTIITASTPIYDSIAGRFLDPDSGGSYTVPADAVVVPGSRKLRSNPDFQVYCPIIVKYRDARTDVSVALENDLRHLMD